MAQGQYPYAAAIHGRVQGKDGVTFYGVRVSCGAQAWEVQHRYNDFRALYDALARQQVRLPPLPEKSNFRIRVSPCFKSSRQEGLDRVLQAALSTDPALLRLDALRFFLQAPGQMGPAMQPGNAQPGYAQAASAMQPGYAQPGYAHPAPAMQPGYAQPGFAHPAPAMQPGYAQPGYAHPVPAMQPGYAQPGYAQPVPAAHHSSGVGMGGVVAAGAAGLVGGMLLEGALEGGRHHRGYEGGFDDGYAQPVPAMGGFDGGYAQPVPAMGGFDGGYAQPVPAMQPGYGVGGFDGGFGSDRVYEDYRPGLFRGEEVIEDVRTDRFGDTETQTEVVDRDMFGNVTDVREEVVDRDMFGNVEDVYVEDGW